MEALAKYWDMAVKAVTVDLPAVIQADLNFSYAVGAALLLFLCNLLNFRSAMWWRSKAKDLLAKHELILEEFQEEFDKFNATSQENTDLKVKVSDLQDRGKLLQKELKEAKADFVAELNDAEAQARSAIACEHESKTALDTALGEKAALEAKVENITGHIRADMEEWVTRLEGVNE